MLFPAVKFQLELMDECRSSQELLLWKRGEPGFHGAAVLARKQTAGYGRRGREWSTGEGNLALSFGLEIPGHQHLGLLPFVVGIALHRVAARILPEAADLRLKWPNDLYLGGKKLSGLISQVRQYAEGAEVVVGVGLNLRNAPEGMPATALAEFVTAPSPEEFAALFLAELEQIFTSEAADFPWVRRHWESLARLSENLLYVVGEGLGVTPLALLETGELLVREKDGRERKLSSEDVSLRFQPDASSTAPSL